MRTNLKEPKLNVFMKLNILQVAEKNGCVKTKREIEKEVSEPFRLHWMVPLIFGCGSIFFFYFEQPRFEYLCYAIHHDCE